MAVSTVMYSGPVTKVEIDTTGSAWAAGDDLGQCSDVKVTWEPTGPENMTKGRIQTGGIGKLELKGMQVNATKLAFVEDIATRQDIRLTVNSAFYIIKNILIKVGLTGEVSDPNKVVTFDLSAQLWTKDLDTFLTFSGA